MTPRPTKYNTGKAGGTKVTEKKGKRKLYKHAFVAMMKSGHLDVFIRVGEKNPKQKQKIRKLGGADPVQLISNQIAQKFMMDTFQKRLKKEIKQAINHFSR